MRKIHPWKVRRLMPPEDKSLKDYAGVKRLPTLNIKKRSENGE